MIETDLIQFFITAGVAGGAVHYYEAPSDAELPFLLITLDDTDFGRNIDEATKHNLKFELSCYGADTPEAATLAVAVKTAIDRYKGAMGAYTVSLAHITNEFDTDEKQSNSYARNLTLSLNYY